MSGVICHSFNIHLSYLGPASWVFFVVCLFFYFSNPPLSQLFSCHYEEGVASAGSQALLSLLGVLILVWRPEIADGCYILLIDTGEDIPLHKDGKVWLFHFPKDLGPWHSSEWQTYSVLANSNFTKCTPCLSFQPTQDSSLTLFCIQSKMVLGVRV